MRFRIFSSILLFFLFLFHISNAQTFEDIKGTWKLVSHTIEIRNNSTNELIESTEYESEDMRIEFRNSDEMYVHDKETKDFFAGNIIINGNQSQCLEYEGQVLQINYFDVVNNVYNEIFLIFHLKNNRLYTYHCQPGATVGAETLIEIAVYEKVN